MSAATIITIIVLAIIALCIILLIAMAIKIVPQSNAFVIERIGKYHTTWKTGIHFKLPIIDRIAKRISLKEQVVNFTPQTVITKDNVTMEIDTVLFFQVTDEKQFTYGVEKPIYAIEYLTATTLRNVIGDLELDRTLTSRDTINGRLQITLDEATNPWGIKVVRVEVKNIQPPREVKEAMEKQMRAEREKRASILLAEGEKQSRILKAEGISSATIKEAEGSAQALLVKQQALAQSIAILNNNIPHREVLALRSLETLGEFANGTSNKIIIPAELQSLSSAFATLGAVFNENNSSSTKMNQKNGIKNQTKEDEKITTVPKN